MNREDEDAWESRDEGRSERGVWACDLHQTQQELPTRYKVGCQSGRIGPHFGQGVAGFHILTFHVVSILTGPKR